MLLSSLGHRLISQELRTTTPTTHHASNQTSYIYLVDHPRFTSRVTPSPISLTVDDLPKQTRNTWLLQMPGVTFGAIFRGTEKPDPTAARLCAKTPSFQFGACDRQGSHGQCSRLGVSHGKSLSEKVTPGICFVRQYEHSPQTKKHQNPNTSSSAQNFYFLISLVAT